MRKLVLVLAIALVASTGATPAAALTSPQLSTLAAIRDARHDGIRIDTTMQAIAERRAREYAPVAGQPGNHHGGYAVDCCTTGEILGWASDATTDDAIAHIVRMWLASPTHKAVMLGRWTGLGIGIARRADGVTAIAVDFIRRPVLTRQAPKVTDTPTSTRQHVSRAEVQLVRVDLERLATEHEGYAAQVASAHALVAIAKLLDELIEEIAQLREELVHQYRSGEPR